MRTLTEHVVIDSASDNLKITVTDNVGSGGANHRYEITGMDSVRNPSNEDSDGFRFPFQKQVVLFQNGPIPEAGLNGVTHEVLLAIVADRLRSFQSGPFACKANGEALTHIEVALHWLQTRTLERMRRNVEGTHTV